jgi:hypothetical protein
MSVWIIAPYPADSIRPSFSAPLETMKALRLMPRRFAPRSMRSSNSTSMRIIVSYGDLFRQSGTMAAGLPPLSASDVDGADERQLLRLFWEEAAKTDDAVMPPQAVTRALLLRLFRER